MQEDRRGAAGVCGCPSTGKGGSGGLGRGSAGHQSGLAQGAEPGAPRGQAAPLTYMAAKIQKQHFDDFLLSEHEMKCFKRQKGLTGPGGTIKGQNKKS